MTTGLAGGVLLMSCSSDSIVGASGDVLSICHIAGTTGSLASIRASELPEHKKHGDYIARLLVDRNSSAAGDSIHFLRIGDALASARALRIARNESTVASCRITIAVAPGLYQGSVKPSSDASIERFPLTIDVPDVTLLGAVAMPVDASGRATGVGSAPPSSLTIIAANPGLVSIVTGNPLDKYAEPMILVNSHPDGPHGDGAVIEGFVLRSGNDAAGATPGGNAVWAMRADRLVVRGNQIEGGFSEPIEMRASGGRIERNYLTGKGLSCAMCLFGPGNYLVLGNRQTGLTGRLSVLVFPVTFAAVPPGVEPLVLPVSSLVTVAVTNNQFRDHQEVPFGIGVRVAAVGPGAPDVVGSARVTIQDNDLSNNRFAIVVEDGFPVANTKLRGDVELTLGNNVLDSSCQVSLLVALNPQYAATGIRTGLALQNSTYALTLNENLEWSDVWYAHPSGAGNTLIVDGQSMANGARVPYDGTKSCPVS